MRPDDSEIFDFRGRVGQKMNAKEYDSKGRFLVNANIEKKRELPIHLRGKNPGKVVNGEENKRYLKKSEGKIVSNYLVHE